MMVKYKMRVYIEKAKLKTNLFFIKCALTILPKKSKAHGRLYKSKQKRKFNLKKIQISNADIISIKNHINNMKIKPLISVIMPVYNTHESFLIEAIESVIQQNYSNWELCIADDCSSKPNVKKVLETYQAKDKRIKVIFRTTNGHISAASNSALELAKGDYIALLDHDDILHINALYEVAAEINAHPDADIIYTDEDKIDKNGIRSGGYFKTDFNPELLLGQNFISHLGVYRRCLIIKIGGFRLGYEGSQDYDLVLRACQATKTEHIRHIPIVLYHWRHVRSQTSYSQQNLNRCVDAAYRAIEEHLEWEGEGAKVVANPHIPSFSRIIRTIPNPTPLVSVIVPTKDQSRLLSVCMDGVLNATDYTNLEIIIIDHESRDSDTHSLFAKLRLDPRVRIIPYSGAFNYSAMNNMAVSHARGEVIALLNNDIEVKHPSWLEEMVSHAIRPDIGAVGAKLYYPDGRIQHAGVVIGLGGLAGHAFCFETGDEAGYFGQAKLTRAVSAVTGACMVVRRSVFNEVGGLNEMNLKVAFNDIDLCLKIQAAGYRNVFTPFAELIHHESASRGYEDTPEKQARFQTEVEYMQATWDEVIKNDPFYNPNLTLRGSNYATVPTRRPHTWASF